MKMKTKKEKTRNKKEMLDLCTDITQGIQNLLSSKELVQWMRKHHGHVDSSIETSLGKKHYRKRSVGGAGSVSKWNARMWDTDAVSGLLDQANHSRVIDLLGVSVKDTVSVLADSVMYAKCLLVGLRSLCPVELLDRCVEFRTLKRHVSTYDNDINPLGDEICWLGQRMTSVRCAGAVSGWTEMLESRYVDFVGRSLMDVIACIGSGRWYGYRSMYRQDQKTGSGVYEAHKLQVSGYGMQKLALSPRLLNQFSKRGYVQVPVAMSNKTNKNTASMSAFIVDFDELVCHDTTPNTDADADVGCIGLGGMRSLLAWLDRNHVGYLVHSTSKHTWKHPRLRVLVPLDESVDSGVYKPLYETLMRLSGCVGYDTKCMSLHRYFVDPKLHATKHPVFFVRAGSCLSAHTLRKEMRNYAEHTIARKLERLSGKSNVKSLRGIDGGGAGNRFDKAKVPVFPPSLVSDAVDRIDRALTSNGIDHAAGHSAGKPVVYVQCVNHKKHTTTKATDTYITVNTTTSYTGMPVYHCSHDSCASLNRQKVLKKFLGENVADYSILSRVHLLDVVRKFLQGSVPGVYNTTDAYPKCLVTNPGTKNSVVLTTDTSSALLVAEAITNDSEFGHLYAHVNMLDVVKEYIGRKLHRLCSAHPLLCRVDVVGHGVVGDEIRKIIGSKSRTAYVRPPNNRHYGSTLGSNSDHPIVHILTGCYGEDTLLLAEHFSGMSRVITQRTIKSARINLAELDARRITAEDHAKFNASNAHAGDFPWVYRKALPVTILDWTRRRVRIHGVNMDTELRVYDGRQVRVIEDIDSIFRYRMRGFLESLHLGGHGIMIVCCHNQQDAMRFRKSIGIRSDGITSLNKFKKAIGLVESDACGSTCSNARLVTTLYRNTKYVHKHPNKKKKYEEE
jgi:hypothetical protein